MNAEERLKEIKIKLEKSNKYMMFVEYDDIRFLINTIDIMNKKSKINSYKSRFNALYGKKYYNDTDSFNIARGQRRCGQLNMKEDIKVLENFIDKQKSNKGTFVPTDFEITAIENLIKENKELRKPKYIIDCKTNKITKLTNDFVSKDKIKNKIEDLEDNMILFTNDKEKFNRYKYARDVLEKILGE